MKVINISLDDKDENVGSTVSFSLADGKEEDLAFLTKLDGSQKWIGAEYSISLSSFKTIGDIHALLRGAGYEPRAATASLGSDSTSEGKYYVFAPTVARENVEEFYQIRGCACRRVDGGAMDAAKAQVKEASLRALQVSSEELITQRLDEMHRSVVSPSA